MKTQDVKKIVELQGKIIKLRERILTDVKRHNDMVISELRPLTHDVLHNTIYELNGVTYKRGRVFSQLECLDYGLGPKADGLATLRKVEVRDAPSDDAESGQTTPVSE